MVCGCNKKAGTCGRKRNENRESCFTRNTQWRWFVLRLPAHFRFASLSPLNTAQTCRSVLFFFLSLDVFGLEQSRFPLCYGTWSRGLVRSVPPFRKHVLHPSSENLVLNPYEPQISHRNWGVATLCRLLLRTLFFSEYGGSKFVRKLSRHLPSCKASCAIRPNVHVFRISNLTK
jgi:hypothetical protein